MCQKPTEQGIEPTAAPAVLLPVRLSCFQRRACPSHHYLLFNNRMIKDIADEADQGWRGRSP